MRSDSLFSFPGDDRIGGIALQRPKSLREVRAAFLQVATLLNEGKREEGIVLLVEPSLETKPLIASIEQARQVLRPDISKHLHVVVKKKGRLDISGGWGNSDSPDFATWFQNVSTSMMDRPSTKRPKGFSDHIVTMVLLRDWLKEAPARSMREIQEITGLSYPTVKHVLNGLDQWIKRSAYKKIELAEFPYEAWKRLVIQADRARETIHYGDPNRMARSTQKFLSRLQDAHPHIAVGGVVGAQYYEQKIDIVGTPRLDITLHQEYGDVDTSWVTGIDPALERMDSRKALHQYVNPVLVIHVLRRTDALFEDSPKGYRVADPAECLLDLIDLRLTDQARSFVTQFHRKIPIDA